MLHRIQSHAAEINRTRIPTRSFNICEWSQLLFPVFAKDELSRWLVPVMHVQLGGWRWQRVGCCSVTVRSWRRRGLVCPQHWFARSTGLRAAQVSTRHGFAHKTCLRTTQVFTQHWLAHFAGLVVVLSY